MTIKTKNPYRERHNDTSAEGTQHEAFFNRGFELGYIEGEYSALDLLRQWEPSLPYHEFAANVRRLMAETELPVALRITALLEAVWGLTTTVVDDER